MKTKMSTGEKSTLHVLNDLIRINMDRIAGFEKAAHEDRTPGPPLRDAFYRMAIEGRAFVNSLHARVILLGGAPVTQSTITGKIYLNWLEAHSRFDGPDSSACLEACRAAGAATEEAYNHALGEQLPDELHELIEDQLWALERGHLQLAQLATHA